MNYENLNDIDKFKCACFCGELGKAREFYKNSSFDLKEYIPKIIETLSRHEYVKFLQDFLLDFEDQIKEIEHKINKSYFVNLALERDQMKIMSYIYNNIKPEETLLSFNFSRTLSRDDLETFKIIFVKSYDFQREDINEKMDFLNKTFYEACLYDAIKIARYLYHLGADFKYNCDQSFRRTRTKEEIKDNRNCKVINWLLNQAPNRYYINKNYEPCINSKFEF